MMLLQMLSTYRYPTVGRSKSGVKNNSRKKSQMVTSRPVTAFAEVTRCRKLQLFWGNCKRSNGGNCILLYPTFSRVFAA